MRLGHIWVAVVDRTVNPTELKDSTLRPRCLSLPRMSITRELRDRLSPPASILPTRSAIDIRLCFAKGAIFVHRKQQRSGHIHTLGSTVPPSGLRGIAMSEPIKSQSISRRRLFWLAVTAAALAAPATILSTSDVRAQQSDQAPAAEPTAPKTGEKKKKKTKKKATPGATTAPASSPPTPPKQP